MKNIIALIFIGIMIMSCGSTQEVAPQKPVMEESLAKTQVRHSPEKRASFDPEQMAAQLGLSDEITDEFVTMWNSSTEEMQLVRRKHRHGDKKVLFGKMKDVKSARDKEMKRILTDAQLAHYYEIMAKNRATMDPGLHRRRGN